MAWLDKFNPTPAFPSYTGPFKVGSTHVEIPASELDSSSPSPKGAPSTLSFRIFYPCHPASQKGGGRWIPDPQREYIGAYAQFLGANSAFAQIFAFVPQLLYYITIPVHRDAGLLEPPSQKRWPVMVFSHGLGGSMNAYSHLCGSLSSHGLVVVAPDHRDGSCPVSFVTDPQTKKLQKVEYRKIAHKPSPETYEARDEQLRIRLWELGLIHDALLKVDKGSPLTNLQSHLPSKRKATDNKDLLGMFVGRLDVHTPGSISFAGHSFGAASVVQFMKATFYPASDSQDPNYKPLFNPSRSSSIVRQVTSSTPVALLDLWNLPLLSPATAWTKAKPMPCYHSAEGGSRLVAILSDAFFKWKPNLRETLITVSKPSNSNFPDQAGPHIFYPISSAHLSQSDFGVLFRWATTKIFGAKEPERVLRLNVRAILQTLRNSGIEVAATSALDRELAQNDVATAEGADSPHDLEILSTTKGTVRDWISLDTHMPLGDEKEEKGPADAVVEGEVLGEVIKPSDQ